MNSDKPSLNYQNGKVYQTDAVKIACIYSRNTSILKSLLASGLVNLDRTFIVEKAIAKNDWEIMRLLLINGRAPWGETCVCYFVHIALILLFIIIYVSSLVMMLQSKL